MYTYINVYIYNQVYNCISANIRMKLYIPYMLYKYKSIFSTKKHRYKDSHICAK